MNLGQEDTVLIGGRVVDVQQGGDDVFRAGGLLLCSATGAELDIHMKPLGWSFQIAYRVDSTHDLGMDGPEWMPLDGHK